MIYKYIILQSFKGGGATFIDYLLMLSNFQQERTVLYVILQNKIKDTAGKMNENLMQMKSSISYL